MTPGASKDRRAQLTRAAFEVFVDRGYRNSSVADIVGAAGVSHGLFYNYFTNRREILDAVIDLGLKERASALSPPAEPAEDLEGFLKAMTESLRALHSLSLTDNKLISLIVFDAGAIDEQLTERVVEIFRSFVHTVQHQIERGVQAGYLRAGLDTEVLGEMFLCMALVALLPAQGGCPLPGGLDHLTSQAEDLLRAGLAR
jgi:AcrR family transcriptional regulator